MYIVIYIYIYIFQKQYQEILLKTKLKIDIFIPKKKKTNTHQIYYLRFKNYETSTTFTGDVCLPIFLNVRLSLCGCLGDEKSNRGHYWRCLATWNLLLWRDA